MVATRLCKGVYEYKGYRIVSYRYHKPCNPSYWEAINNDTGCVDYYANSKTKVMAMIDEDIKEEPKVISMKCKHNDCFTCPYPDCINDYVKLYDADYNKKYKEEYKSELNAKQRQLRAEKKANGICTRCGKRPVQEGKTKCIECLLKLREYSINRNREQGRLPRELLNEVDLCKKCSKSKPVEGYKLCETCLEQARQAIVYGRSVRMEENYKKFTR